MLRLLLLLVALTTVGVQGQDQQAPQRCCVDRQFTAMLGEIGQAVSHGKGVPVDGYNLLTYDYDNKMMKVEAHLTTGGVLTNTTVLIDYSAGKQYVTTDDGKCYYSPVAGPMREPCIPANATFFRSVAFGSSADNLKMNIWQFSPPGEDGVTAKLAVSASDCTPIVEASSGIINGAETQVSYFFTNFQPTISDPSALTVPPNCAPLPTSSPNNPPVGRRSLFFG